MAKTWDILIRDHRVVKEVAYEDFKKAWRMYLPLLKYLAIFRFKILFEEVDVDA